MHFTRLLISVFSKYDMTKAKTMKKAHLVTAVNVSRRGHSVDMDLLQIGELRRLVGDRGHNSTGTWEDQRLLLMYGP